MSVTALRPEYIDEQQQKSVNCIRMIFIATIKNKI